MRAWAGFTALVMVAGGVAVATPARAADATVTFRVEATVTQVTQAGLANVGDALVLEYSFDPATPSSYETDIFATYPATHAMSLSIAGDPVVTAPSGTISVVDDGLTGSGQDLYRADFFGLSEVTTHAPLTLDETFLQMTSLTGAISGLGLPSVPPDPTEFVYFDSPYVALVYEGPSCSDPDFCERQYVIASVTAISVVAAGPDADGDGVADAIGTGSGAFNDGTGTGGQIVSGSGVLVEDVPAPAGVRITTTLPASLLVCGFFTINLSAGSDVTVTCGSVSVKVSAGLTTVGVGPGGEVAVGVGGDVTVARLSDEDFTVTNNGTDPVTIRRAGVEAELPGGAVAVTSTTPTTPQIDVGDDVVLAAGEHLTRSGMVVDPDVPDAWVVTADFGDGSSPQVVSSGGGKSFSLDHQYSVPGTYAATVTVVDAVGATAHDALVVTVQTPKQEVLAAFEATVEDLGIRASVASGLRSTLATAATLAERGRIVQARAAMAAFRAQVAVALLARKVTKPQAQALVSFAGSASTSLGL
jgi:hypothetical protein